jgi:hypothetical protein
MAFNYYPEIMQKDASISQKLSNYFDNKQAQKIILKKGDMINYCDYPGKFLFLQKGKGSVCLVNSLGTENILWYIDEGNIILNDSEDDIFYVVMKALTGCVLFVRGEDEILDLICGDREMVKYFFDCGRKRGKIMGARNFSMISESSPCRVYRLLYQLAETYGQKITENKIIIEKIPTQGEMSSLISVHRTNVVKYLSFLEDHGVITKSRHGIMVNNLSELKNLIEHEASKNE